MPFHPPRILGDPMSWLETGFVAVLLLGGAVLLPMAQAETTTVTYVESSGDLFPDDDRADLNLAVEGGVDWSLNEGTLSPGEALQRTLLPAAGPLILTADYHFDPRCCPNQERQGTETVTDDTPLGCVDIPIPVDGSWTLIVTLCGVLDGRWPPQGPGDVSPTTGNWQVYEGQDLRISADSQAQDGDRLRLSVNTEYGFEVSAEVEHSTGWNRSSDRYTSKDIKGTPTTFERTYTVTVQQQNQTSSDGAQADGEQEGDGTSGPSIPGPASGVILLSVVSVGVLLRRRDT